LEELIHGIEIDGVRYGSIDANLERRTGANTWVEMRLTEGKNREVRRVLEHLGLRVSRLIRTSYGPFGLGDLEKGEVAEIDRNQLFMFRQSLAKQGGPKERAPERDASAGPSSARRTPSSPAAAKRQHSRPPRRP
jgi:23S rRNA pseudouridine2605 synthase